MENSILNFRKLTYSTSVDNYYPKILSDEALQFLIALHEKFHTGQLELLESREEQQKEFDKGLFPEFPKETKDIRDKEWTAGNIPHDLQDRRVEITGPVDRKMIINALNSSDFPVLKAMSILSAIAYILFTLIQDIVYTVVDPRVKLQ